MNWKAILTGATVLACSAALLAGCGSSEKAPSTDNAAEMGKIIVGLDDNFPPMGFKDENNKIVGFDVDLAEEAAKRLGREVEFKAIDWSSKEAELKSGRVQVLWNGLDITEKRKENMLFSKPYMDNHQIIFVKKGSTAVTRISIRRKSRRSRSTPTTLRRSWILRMAVSMPSSATRSSAATT